MRTVCAIGLVLVTGLLGACSTAERDETPTETLKRSVVSMSVEAQGELRAVKATPLTVPGEQWAQRRLVWALPEGSLVKAGDVIARFSAEQGKLELAKAELDLRRNALARAAKESELDSNGRRIGVDLAQVATDLGIAQRYAHVDLDMFARNEVLDAVQDERFLGVKRDSLQWRQGQSSARGSAELGVLDSQRATYAIAAKTRQGDIAALELVAPHDGVLVLAENWSGEKPRIGAAMWAGFEFGSLPDTHAMEVQLFVPQLVAAGLKPGTPLRVAALGQTDAAVDGTLSWVASAAQPRNRDNPVKYLAMKAAIPAEAVARLHLVPGQTMVATLYLDRSADALTVPNIALREENGKTWVERLRGGAVERREVTLGARGPARSEVREGLAEGDRVLLATPSAPAAP